MWKYLSIITGQDMVVCVPQKDFVRVAGLFLKGSCVNFSWEKSTSRLGKEVVAGGGGFGKSIGNSRSHFWKDFNGHVKSGNDLFLEKQ